MPPDPAPRAGAITSKTLLLVGSVPGDRNVGQILLREMLGCVNPERFVIASLLGANEIGEPAPIPGLRIFRRPDEHARRKYPGRLGGIASAFGRMRDYEPAIAALSDDVLAYARANGVSQVWAILNMPSVVDTCARLMDRLPVPLLAHVWDDIGHLAQERGLDNLTRRRTRRRFGRLLAGAERTAVIGETMASRYAIRYGARCSIVRHGVSDAVVACEQASSDSEFVIGFSGGMYCPSAWKSFQAALDKLGWRAGNKRIRLVVMSGHVTFTTCAPAHVDFLGWRNNGEVHARLSKCDLLYLPQPFEPSQRELAELSFPTKLSAYVGTGRPVLVHAPAYASLPVFAQSHPLGAVCTSLDPEAVAAAIDTLARDPQRYAQAARDSAAVANTVLSRANFTAQVRAFLGEAPE